MSDQTPRPARSLDDPDRIRGDHRDSTVEPSTMDAAAVADDLLLDAILAVRATDDDASVRDRVRAACAAIDAPLATLAPISATRPTQRGRWRPLVAAAVVMAAAGLLSLLVALPSPAYATVDASLERLTSSDLTFRISVETDDATAPGGRADGRPSGFQRRFDGAILHVSGPRVVMLTTGRQDALLARGHDGTRFWSNHLPDEVESAISSRGERGIPFHQFLDAIEGDLRGLLGGLRRGYAVRRGEDETDSRDGATLRRFTGLRRAGVSERARPGSSEPGERPRRRFAGPPERFDVWIDDRGNLRRLRLSGLPGRDGGSIGDLILELVDTAPLDESIFDPASYPEIERTPVRRDGGGARSPRRDDRRPRRPS